MRKIWILNKKRYSLMVALSFTTALFFFVAQTCSGQIANSTGVQSYGGAADFGVLHVVPLVWLLLPVAAVGAYFLERVYSKMQPSKSM
jgi:hypothetical protein